MLELPAYRLRVRHDRRRHRIPVALLQRIQDRTNALHDRMAVRCDALEVSIGN
jgi:hypothetical protein